MKTLVMISLALPLSVSVALGGPASSPADGTTFEVNSTEDRPDLLPGDGECNTGLLSPAGDAECTLRASLQEFNKGLLPGPYRINVPAGTYIRTVMNDPPWEDENMAARGDLDVAVSIFIHGGGGPDDCPTIAADDIDRVFDIQPGAAGVWFHNLCITEGHARFGGGIRNRGDLLLSDNLIFHNEAQNGGGISNSGTANLTLADTVVRDNTAFGDGGGGIANQVGTVQLVHSAVLDNRSVNQGGGIRNHLGSVFIEDESEVAVNLAGFIPETPPPLPEFPNGGGIWNASGTVSVSDSKVRGNTAVRGGGVYNRPGAEIRISDDTLLTENIAAMTGGGIHNEGDLHITDQSRLRANQTFGDGGAIYNEDTLTVSDSFIGGQVNSAARGGGIFNNGGSVTLDNTRVSDCTAQGRPLPEPAVPGRGGGIFNAGELTVVNACRFTNNFAADSGAGLYKAAGTATIDNSVFINNTAIDRAGGILADDTLILTNSQILNNRPDGVTIVGGLAMLENNGICFNGRDGVRIEGDSTVDLGTLDNGSAGNNTLGENGQSDEDAYELRNLSNTTVHAHNNSWNPIPPRTYGSVQVEPFESGVCSGGGLVVGGELRLPGLDESALQASESAGGSSFPLATIAGAAAAAAVLVAGGGWLVRRRLLR